MRLVLERRGTPMMPNLTPMVDVVFQLIVFFIATSTLARLEFSQAVDLPEARSGEPVNSATPLVAATVLPDGRVFVGAQRVSTEQLTQLLKLKAEQVGREEVEFYIRADEETTYANIEPLLEAATRAGIWKVRFGVQQADVER